MNRQIDQVRVYLHPLVYLADACAGPFGNLSCVDGWMSSDTHPSSQVLTDPDPGLVCGPIAQKFGI